MRPAAGARREYRSRGRDRFRGIRRAIGTARSTSGWRRHIIPAFGIGPLDTLANAVQVVQFFKEEIGTSHIIWKPGKRSRIEPRVS
jgi:hypothetical protein